MTPSADDARERSRALLNAGEFARSLEVARDGLSVKPDDVELLVIAGRAGVETDSSDAVDYLRRATELAPREASAWHHLGEALAADGLTGDADAAFRRAVELDPDNQIALTHLGHTSLAGGRDDEAVAYLARAAEGMAGASTAAISLVEMYRSLGRYEEAAAQAKRIVEAVPGDVLAWLDVADLSLDIGHRDDARMAFERLRDLDDTPGHEVFPIHGMLQVAIRAEDWGQAERLIDQATAVDPQGLGTDIGAFLRARSQGQAPEQRPAPSQSEVEAALAASLVSYRRMLADDRRLSPGDRIA